MKNLKVMLLFAVIMFVLPTVYAGTAYVDNMVIEAKINTDGSMTVKETILWNIEEDLNGLYRNILIKNPSNELNSASGIVISDVVVDDEKFEYSYSNLQNGDSGKYNINEIDNGKQIKIFTPSSDEYKTTTITYTLYDVITEYNDIAELYWNFIGDGWDYGIDGVNIQIILPGDSEMLKAFAHGPLYGYSAIPSKNSVILEVDSLRSGEQVDARILLDKSLVDATKVVYEDKLESILQEEAILAEEANLKRELAKKAFYISIAVVTIALILPIVIYLKAHKKAYRANFNGKYYRELPEDYGPAIMNKVLYPTTGTASSYDMLATLLDLVRRKYVEIEPITKVNKKKPTDYLLKLVNNDLSELNESEKHFIENLIFVDTNEITLKELEKKNSRSFKSQSKALENYTKWTEIITKVAKEKDLLKAESVKIGKNVLKCVFCLLLLIAVAVYGFISNYEDVIGIGMMGLFLGICELIAICISLHELNVRTQKGVEHKAMWKAFKKFLLHFSKLDEHDYKSIAIWEHYLVYATALGISKKVIKELKIVFPTEFEEGSDMFNTYVTINLLSDSSAFSSFSDSFTSAANTAFSAPSSSSGSGGGFSGGAGGRRRRRWRRRILASKKEKIMSSYIMHMCVSDIVKRKLNLTDKFIYGSILPDIIKGITGDRKTTHFLEKVIVENETRNLPMVDRAMNELKIQDKEIRLGYIAHLLEDLIWFKDYIPTYGKKIGRNIIKYLTDNSMHTESEFGKDIYSDYSNSSSYVVKQCNVDIEKLLKSIEPMMENAKYMNLVLENTKCIEDSDINMNKFMTKESMDKYIKQATEEVESLIVKLLGE